MNNIKLFPIGIIHSSRKTLEDDFWGEVISTIEINHPDLDESALYGLKEFSHLQVIYYMHKVEPDKIINGARHPRNDKSLPLVGILAQRAKNRQNQIGLSPAKILEVHGKIITVQGLDAIDGTPVLDIKPHMKEFSIHEPIRQPNWVNGNRS